MSVLSGLKVINELARNLIQKQATCLMLPVKQQSKFINVRGSSFAFYRAWAKPICPHPQIETHSPVVYWNNHLVGDIHHLFPSFRRVRLNKWVPLRGGQPGRLSDLGWREPLRGRKLLITLEKAIWVKGVLIWRAKRGKVFLSITLPAGWEWSPGNEGDWKWIPAPESGIGNKTTEIPQYN